MGMYCNIMAISAADAARLRSDPEAIASSKPARTVSLEKAWHGLHYLLTGSAFEGPPTLGFILQGGQPLGDEDPEEATTRIFAPEEVAQIHAALSSISDDDLWSRFNPEEMTEQGVYPEIWDEDEEDLRDEYLTYFQELKKFLAAAAKDRQSILADVG
jgi:hypothetical protein